MLNENVLYYISSYVKMCKGLLKYSLIKYEGCIINNDILKIFHGLNINFNKDKNELSVD